MKVPARALGWLWLLPALAVGPPGQAASTSAEYAYMIDVSTDTVLFEKNADVPMQPASMSKLMTVYMAFEAIRDGRLSLDEQLPVTGKAAAKRGSRMFLRRGEKARVDDLLRGIIVQSGNDACIVIAEALAGTEENFAKAMTERARGLGLTRSTFTNATGWPHPEHQMSARDIARISEIVIDEFPELYTMFGEKRFSYAGIEQPNRNRLLGDDPSADGLKTGYTQKSRYGIAATAIRDGRRIILVLNGIKSSKRRREETSRLMEWGFRGHPVYTLFEPGEKVVDAKIWLGTRPTVPLVVREGFRTTLTPGAFAKIEVKVRTAEPVAAPVRMHDRVGTLLVSAPGRGTAEVPLLAGGDVERMGVFRSLGAKIRYLLWGSS